VSPSRSRRSGAGSRSGWGFPDAKPRRPGSGPWRAAGKRPFGATWWGRAWVDAIEQRAQLDPNRMPRGRTYARTGAVDRLEISAGSISADVQGSRSTPYQVRVRVRAWTDAEWERVFDAMAGQIGHTAALLDGELQPEVAEDVRAGGLDLLPGPGELQPRCSCPDWADPCKHAAAVCYLVADELDADPFQLLALRGRDRDQVLAALRARRGLGTGTGDALDADADPSGPADPGVVASQAWSSWVAATQLPEPQRPTLPPLPMPPRTAGAPTVLGADAPAGSGLDTAALRHLAADAAGRALDLALGAPNAGLGLTRRQDLARRAAGVLADGTPNATDRLPAGGQLPHAKQGATASDGAGRTSSGTAGSPDFATLAARSGLPARQVLRLALAWDQGGPAAVTALDEQWDPGPTVLARGRALLGPGAVGRRNRVTLGDRQLRIGLDGRWYPYRKVGGSWDPDGPAVTDHLAPPDASQPDRP